MRLLVVDDDAMFRTAFADLLEGDGHRVRSAPSALKAVQLLEQEEFDVVLADLKMPRRGGLDLLREVRSRWPRTLVIMVTGFATVETALDAMKSGAFDYVRKPFHIEQVRETLRLAAQEQEFETPRETFRDPLREAHGLAQGGKYEVLLFTEAPAAEAPHLHVSSIDPAHPLGIVDETERFLREHPNTAVVVAGVDRLLERHRLEEVVTLLDRLRSDLANHGPLRVGFDPDRVGPSAAAALGGAVASEETHAALEALSNPIRRKVILRLVPAPASFGEVMQAADLDDSPKMSFHLRKLGDAGVVIHDGENYRLTARGEALARLLEAATFLPPAGDSGNLAFPGAPPKTQRG